MMKILSGTLKRKQDLGKVFELTAPCHFGMEAVLKREITDLGYDVTKTENGKVSFAGDAEGMPGPTSGSVRRSACS